MYIAWESFCYYVCFQLLVSTEGVGVKLPSVLHKALCSQACHGMHFKSHLDYSFLIIVSFLTVMSNRFRIIDNFL